MKKTALILVTASLFLFAGDYTVTITGKGKFGDELKALIEKYKSSGDIKVVEGQPQKSSSIKQEISNFFFEKKQKETADENARMIKEGKRIYTASCVSCHGSKGLVKAYGRSKQIANMSHEDFIESLKAYEQEDSDDPTASTRTIIMKPYADMLTTDQAESVYKYLQSINKTK